MVLEKIGFFEGYNKKTIRDKLGASVLIYPAEKVVSYLKSGVELCSWLEYTECMYSCTAANIGSEEYTDGEWVWPRELIHYIEHHSIEIPERFLAYLSSKKYKLSGNNNLEQLKSLGTDLRETEGCVSYSNKYWVEWLSSRCPGFDDIELVEYKKTDQYKKEAQSAGYELPDDW